MKDLPKRATADKVLHDATFNIEKKNMKDTSEWGLASMFYKFLDKTSKSGDINTDYFKWIVSWRMDRPTIIKF